MHLYVYLFIYLFIYVFFFFIYQYIYVFYLFIPLENRRFVCRLLSYNLSMFSSLSLTLDKCSSLMGIITWQMAWRAGKYGTEQIQREAAGRWVKAEQRDT